VTYDLKKEFVVTEISASQDGSPYVLISLKDPDQVQGLQRSPFSPAASFRSMDDMFQNIGRIMSKQMMTGFATMIKLSLDEYERLNIKVGERVSLEINKIRVGVP
jgi:hypothetical protein